MTETSDRNKVIELVEEIKSIASNYSAKTFSRERVSHLPRLPIALHLSDGWSWKLVSADTNRDMWMVKGRHGTILPEHFHPDQMQIVTVITGSVLVTTDKTQELKMGESIIIPKNQRHEFAVPEDENCELLIVFQPPLSIHVDP